MELLPAKRTNLLILRGVYPKDFAPIDSIYEKSSSTDVTQVKLEPIVVYTEIPKRFISVESWPNFSNLKCWECDQLPASYPKFIPVNPERDKDGNDVCETHGHFCEWNCAVRFVAKEFPKEQQWDTLQSICLFESKFSGKRREKIIAAPSKTCMKQYCGNSGITPKQYREKMAMLNSQYDLSNYKLQHFRDLDG